MADIDRLTIQIGGGERPFKIGTLGMARAMDRGVDVLQEFDNFTKVYSKAGDASPTKLLITISKIVWAGLLTYDDKIELEQVYDMMDVPAMTRVSSIIADQMSRFMNGAELGESQAPKRGVKSKR